MMTPEEQAMLEKVKLMMASMPQPQEPMNTAPPPVQSQPYLQAEQMQNDAAPRDTAPHGVKQNVVAGIQGLFHPGGFQGMQFQQQQQERQRQQDLLRQVNDLRGEGREQSQQFNQNQYQNTLLEQAKEKLAFDKEKANQPPPAQPFTLGQDQRRFDANNNMVAEGATTPVTQRNLDPNSPEALQNRVNFGPKPQGPQPTKPDYEWVTRGGKPVQIQKGTAQAGDKPYDTVSERQLASSGGESPYSKERAFRTIQSVDELAKKVSGWTTGMGSTLSGIPTSSARDFKAELDTLKANIAFNELAQMRNASKTGGALGQVSDKEGQLLQSALGALDTGQSTENFKTQLQKIKSSIERWSAAMAAAGTSPATGGGDAPQGGGLPTVGGTFNGAKVLKVTPIP